MIIAPSRYTSGRVALANLSASIERLECRRIEDARFEDLVALSRQLFLRGDLLGRIADHDRAEAVAEEAASLAPCEAEGLMNRARLAERFHRFEQAHALLDRACSAGASGRDIMETRAALYQATGKFWEAVAIRERLAREDHRIQTLGALATLSAEMGQWTMAEAIYAEAIEADDGISPLPCAQVLFAWGVCAMRNGRLDRAEEVFAQLAAILPAHVPGRGHRAEVALARKDLETAGTLIAPLLDVSDDPEYVATHAKILAARGNHLEAAREAQRASDAYASLLARRPEAYADHAAAFFMGVGHRPLLAVELAKKQRELGDTPRSRALLAKATRAATERRIPVRASARTAESARCCAS